MATLPDHCSKSDRRQEGSKMQETFVPLFVYTSEEKLPYLRCHCSQEKLNNIVNIRPSLYHNEIKLLCGHHGYSESVLTGGFATSHPKHPIPPTPSVNYNI